MQPADWPASRRQEYFEWAGQVVAGLHGVHPALRELLTGYISEAESFPELVRFQLITTPSDEVALKLFGSAKAMITG